MLEIDLTRVDTAKCLDDVPGIADCAQGIRGHMIQRDGPVEWRYVITIHRRGCSAGVCSDFNHGAVADFRQALFRAAVECDVVERPGTSQS